MFYSNNKCRLSSNPLPEDKEEMISLWQATFKDSDEFTYLFFDRVYKPENALVIKKGGQIISALQMIPYEIKTDYEIIPSAYICGVCTHPSERGNGFMKKLMYEAIEIMRERIYKVSILIPAEQWLYDFYSQFGYVHQIKYIAETYTFDNQTKNTETNPSLGQFTLDKQEYSFSASYHGGYLFKECTIENYYTYFNLKQRERKSSILHDYDDLTTISKDLTLDGGSVYIALEYDKPVGIAFVKPEQDNLIIIKDIAFNSIKTKDAIIHYIANLYKAQKIVVRIPLYEKNNSPKFVNSEVKPYGLACILDKHTMLPTDLFMTLMLD